MESFVIKTSMTTNEYAKVMFIGLYKKPFFIIATLMGLYLLITVCLDYMNVIHYYSETPLFEIFGGAFLLLVPTLIVLLAVKQFRSNPNLPNEITYIFSENGIAIQGVTFKSEVLWAHIIKQKEIGKFLILYHSKRFGNYVDKTKLTLDQLAFIKSKAKQK